MTGLLGIVGAMPEEMEMIIASITNKEIYERGGRLYYKGKLFGRDVIAVFSRWGKVAAATTVTNMILEFKVESIVFTGVAGGISPELNVGDIVIAQRLFQHDMDARPLMRRFEIPLTGKTSFAISETSTDTMKKAVHQFLVKNKEFRKELSKHEINNPRLMMGDVASGDLFISTQEMKEAIIRNLPSVACVEMEGAAVAQVCDDYQIPLTVVRVISDLANDEASVFAMEFVLKHAGNYSLAILKEYIDITSAQNQ